jgi:hypothetical protein
MPCDVPEDASEEELKEIQNVLEESIANSLGVNPEDIRSTIDPKTGEAKYIIFTNDQTFAKQTRKVLNTDDFVENVNQGIDERSQELPDRIRIYIEDVNFLFRQKIFFSHCV